MGAALTQDGAVPSDDVEKVTESDGSTSWGLFTEEEDVRSVWVSFRPDDGWPWQIDIPVAEFVREEPLETTFRTRVQDAIRVEGITEVAEEDREVWLARGQADGEAIARAVGDVLDAMAPELEAAMEMD